MLLTLSRLDDSSDPAGAMELPLTALLLALYRAGWRTIVSCLENGEAVIIRASFGSEAEVEAFLDIAAPLDRRDDLFDRARARWGTWAKSPGVLRPPGEGASWDYSLDIEETLDPEASAGVTIFAVHFPGEDLETVLERLRRVNEAAEAGAGSHEPGRHGKGSATASGGEVGRAPERRERWRPEPGRDPSDHDAPSGTEPATGESGAEAPPVEPAQAPPV